MPRDGTRARDRLREAALELYAERGYEATTTAEIAARAGVTERTYFRHFADKREVLFDGEAELARILEGAVVGAPAGLVPLAVLEQAFTQSVPLFVANRVIAQRRAAIIATTPALQERALAKSAALVDRLAGALVMRGVESQTAGLAAQVGMATFEAAVRSWDDASGETLIRLIAASAQTVLALVEA